MFFYSGTYSLAHKTFTSKEVGLPKAYQRFKFKLYQQVFNIYLIPFWPGDQYWKIVDTRTNQEVTPDAAMIAKLNVARARTRSVLWAYFGALVIGLSALALMLYLLINPFV